jgi:hypothetical protein
MLFSAKKSWSAFVPRKKGMSFGEPRSRPVCSAMPARFPTVSVFRLLPLASDRTCACAFQRSAL